MNRSFYLPFKRLLDLVLSITGLILLLPIFLIISIWIKSESDGPILFKQKRVARSPKGVINHFYIYKFRTMRIDSPHDTPTHLLENADQWITNSGKFLRKKSLDELPQILNILKGEMSIIGPRPALWNQYDLIEAREKYAANDIKPGLTGLAQISGRDELPLEVKAKLDGIYTSNISFRNDVKLFFQTVFSVLRSYGIHEGKQIED